MNSLKRDLLKGIFFVLAAGSLAHFIYEWSGYSTAAGLFFPVNESTWEHMKLVFFPMLLFTLLASRKLSGEYHAASGSLLLGNLIGTLGIPVFFYTYTGILGRNIFALDIAVFLAAVLSAFAIAWKTKDSRTVRQYQYLIWFVTAVFAVMFFVFTFFPPGIGLFAEPSV